MQRAFLIALCTVAFFTHSAADDKPTIPPGVHYKFIDDKLDAAIRASLAAKFQQGEVAVTELFQGPCLFAPGYWGIVADSGCIRHPIPTSFSVPNLKTGVKAKLKGATTKDPEDLHRIAQHFSSDVGKTPVIRRLTTDELSQMWAVVPFDLEEPIYVLENGTHRFVICLMKGSSADTYGIWWVDDLAEYDHAKSD
jgi:hypothetical protein